ncbi:MAG: type II toxin-antitoxin system RelB/DinJ family antitoxin [Ruminococcus sp.]|jgi:addiction module RelB/DinJ family antitoxin|nr:type II toxin-antitoxin system RelB/DinJ family antitoxin [Ruminococcus sp.]
MTKKDNYIQIRVQPEIKSEFEKICSRMGISPSTAMSIFINATINTKGIPFPVTAKSHNDIEFVSENRADELSKEIMTKYHTAFERLAE